MARLPASSLTRAFGALKPAVKPLSYGAAVVGGGLAVGYAGSRIATAAGRAFNPPAQTGTFDTDPTRPGPESGYVFDPRSGRTITYGDPPSDRGNPDRNQDRDNQRLLYAFLAAAGVAAAIIISRS